MFGHQASLATFNVNNKKSRRQIIKQAQLQQAQLKTGHTPQQPLSLSSGHALSIEFNKLGNKLAAIFDKGHVNVWHFNVPRSINRREFKPFIVT